MQAGRHVTFLVRPGRAAQLSRSGLRIRSRFGDVSLPDPPIVTAGQKSKPFDLVLLSCKAYQLNGAIDSLAPFTGPRTVILPLLNGMRHLDILDERLGRERVLGGRCLIAATLEEDGAVAHLNDSHSISFGERDGSLSDRVRAIEELLRGVRFDSLASAAILLEMWEKWVFLASLAAGTCLMRAAVGEICAAPGGSEIMLRLLDECRAVATANGHPPRIEPWQRAVDMLTAPGSALTASMLRDMERGAPTEADHVIGDLLQRANAPSPYLQLAYANVTIYENRRRATAPDAIA